MQSRILGFEGIEPPGGCCGAIAPEQMQRRIGESHEEHIARVTALIRQATEAMKRINAEMKTALSDEKIKQAVQLFVSREAEKYKEMLDGHWTRIDNTLDHLLQRIPYNYDINKRLVKACI